MVRVEDESFFLPKVCFTKPLLNFRALFTYIYRAQRNNWASVQWAYQSKGEDRIMGLYLVNIKSSHKWLIINMHNYIIKIVI